LSLGRKLEADLVWAHGLGWTPIKLLSCSPERSVVHTVPTELLMFFSALLIKGAPYWRRARLVNQGPLRMMMVMWGFRSSIGNIYISPTLHNRFAASFNTSTLLSYLPLQSLVWKIAIPSLALLRKVLYKTLKTLFKIYPYHSPSHFSPTIAGKLDGS
jgi:hypothetical protein